MILYQLNEVHGIEDELKDVMKKLSKHEKKDLWVMVFTSIHDNGSVLFGAGELAGLVEMAFPNNPGETHSFHDTVVSRKNQIIPQLSLVINQYEG